MAAAPTRRRRPDLSAGRAPPPGGRRRWWWPSMSSWQRTVPGAAWCVIARSGDFPSPERRPAVILRDDPTIICVTDDPHARGRYGGAVETWGRLVTRLRRMDPYRADLLLAALLLAEMSIEVALLPAPSHTRAGIWLICLVEAFGVALRRRATILGATIIAAGFLTLISLVPQDANTLEVPWFVILIGVYSVGANLDGRRLWLGVALSAVPAMLAVYVAPDAGDASSAIFAGLILLAAPLLIGRVMRHRSRLNRALRARTRQLDEERAARAEQAMIEERTRIAGELHDVVAHGLSAMVVQASAARRLVPRDPDRAESAFASVETTGRDALTEIRSLLGVLRREDEDLALAPQPSLSHVSSLVNRTSAAGLPVELSVEGDARPLPAGGGPPAPRPLPAGADLTAYRVLQAALGGALEHGGAGRAEVTVRYGAERVEVEVFD